jgi:hypothetical protein
MTVNDINGMMVIIVGLSICSIGLIIYFIVRILLDC